MTENLVSLTFDLREQSADRSRAARSLRQVMVLLLCLVTGVLAWFVVIGLTEGVAGFQWIALITVLSCVSFLVGEFSIVLWKTRPGAVELSVGADGLEIRWLSGKIETLPWAGLYRGVALYDNSGVDLFRAHSRNLWELRRWNRPITCLSKDAFDSIVESASRAGIVVHELQLRPGPFRWTASRAIRFSHGTRAART